MMLLNRPLQRQPNRYHQGIHTHCISLDSEDTHRALFSDSFGILIKQRLNSDLNKFVNAIYEISARIGL